MNHKGRHQRGYLPHCDFPRSIQAITFRLGDALPTNVIASWKKELAADIHSFDQKLAELAKAELCRRVAVYKDKGHGSRLLAYSEHASTVQDCIIKGHGWTR